MSARLTERLDWESAIRPVDINGAGADGDWIRMTGRQLLIAIESGAWAGGSSAITLQQATDNAGTGAKALGFTRRWEKTTGLFSELAVTSDTFDVDAANTLHLIEVQAAELDADNDFAYVRVRAASPGANADLLSAEYLLGELRYGTLLEDREDPKA